MLGLGSNASKSLKAAAGKWITTDNLVLRHDYRLHLVQPLSDGAAYFVSGNTDYISLDVGDALTPIVDDFSVSLWVKLNTLGGNQMMMAGANGTSQRFYVADWGGKWDFGIGSQGAGSGAIDTTSEWTHIAVTLNGSGDSAQLYVNGVKSHAKSPGAFNDGTFGSNFAFGAHGTGTTAYNLDGYLCNAGLWERELTQTDIKSIMWKNYSSLTGDATSGEKQNLVSWWNLDEETATDGTAGSGGVKDYHSTNHGTLG